MAHIIHSRWTKRGYRFRVWSTVVDRYLTPPLTREKAFKEIVEYEVTQIKKETARRLDLAETKVSEGPWDRELCPRCGWGETPCEECLALQRVSE